MILENEIEEAIQQLADYLKSKHLRCTQERNTVLRQVMSYSRHFTAEQLIKDVCEKKHISQATIYNTLLLLTECHIIRRLAPQANSRVVEYERIKGHANEMRFVCTRCAREVTFKHKMVEKLLMSKQFTNFNPANFVITVYGTCKTCRRKIN